MQSLQYFYAATMNKNYNDILINFINENFDGNIRKCSETYGVEYSSLNRYYNKKLDLQLVAAKNIDNKIFAKTGKHIFRVDNYLEPINSKIIEIQVHEATLAAGYENQEPKFDTLTEEKVMLTEDELLELQVKYENLQAFKITGDSMQYTINEESKVVVDRKQKDIIDNRVYAITYGNELLARVKRLRKTAKGLLIMSDNKAYEDELIEYNSGVIINIIGRVVCVFNKL